MSKKIDTSTLGYLGTDYQLRLIKCFIEEPQFFTSIASIVDQNMFTDEHFRRLVGLIKDRYNSTSTVPTYFDLETLIRTKITDAIAVEQNLAMLDKIRLTAFDAIDLIKDEAGKFFKQQNLSKALNKAQDIIKKGNSSDYYVIEDIIRNALETNTKQDMGFRLFDDIDNDLRDDYRQTISTGCEELDKALYGGLGKGELGLIISPLGTGKTSLSTGFAAAAATTFTEANNWMGYKVLHFFFEDEEVSIRRKYYGYMLDIDACDLSQPDIRPIALKRLNELTEEHHMLRENIRGERLRTGEVTASEIKIKINAYIARGFCPDLVIIDYFECLKPEKGSSIGDSEWTREGVTMRKLESIANELNIAMWVPVQGTKGSIGQDFVGLMHAGGSVSKTQIGHVVITLARTEEMKSQGKISLYIQKLRAARIGRDKFINVGFNNGTCKFDMSESDDFDGVDVGQETRNQAMMVAKSIAKNRK